MSKLFIPRTFVAPVVALSCGLFAAPAFAQQVSLTIKNGLVTLKAENATPRQILDEWARVGQAKVVNAEKLTGPPVTLSLVDVPERQALDTVLRSAAGYMAVDRATPVAAVNASTYDRIMIMTKTTQASAAAAAPAAQSAAYTPPQPVEVAPAMADDAQNASNEPPPPTAPVASPYSQAPGYNAGGNANAARTGSSSGFTGFGNTYSNNAGAAAGSGVGMTQTNSTGTVNTGAANANGDLPEVKFDYANPLPYFERQRQLQQMQQQQQQAAQGPTATPTGTGSGGLTSQPGVSPVQPAQQQSYPANFNPYNPPPNFNPYNLKPGEPIPGSTATTPNTAATPATSSNPYKPQQP